MKRWAFVAAISLFLQSCSSGVWDAAFTGMCIAADASCQKDCRNSYRSGDSSGFGYDACVSSCSSGCAFTGD